MAAVCMVPALPRAASAALAAGWRVPGGSVTVATHDGALSPFRRTPGTNLGSCLVGCLRQLSMQPASEARTSLPADSAPCGGADGQERLADALLASSAASWQRERAAQEALVQKQRGGGLSMPGGVQEPDEAAGPEARVQLPHPPVQLAFAATGVAGGLLLALSRGAGGQLCCLSWPGLQQMGPLLEGVAGVLALGGCDLGDANAGMCCIRTPACLQIDCTCR